ncbi:hypothetical protein F5146DRAFT_1135139 [Armillaria mellea]|nr:hypothetical protein F5146DRAFT_1135139 [Armillaria mellea]
MSYYPPQGPSPGQQGGYYPQGPPQGYDQGQYGGPPQGYQSQPQPQTVIMYVYIIGGWTNSNNSHL